MKTSIYKTPKKLIESKKNPGYPEEQNGPNSQTTGLKEYIPNKTPGSPGGRGVGPPSVAEDDL